MTHAMFLKCNSHTLSLVVMRSNPVKKPPIYKMSLFTLIEQLTNGSPMQQILCALVVFLSTTSAFAKDVEPYVKVAVGKFSLPLVVKTKVFCARAKNKLVTLEQKDLVLAQSKH